MEPKPNTITCYSCGAKVPTIDWAGHRMSHVLPGKKVEQTQMFKPTKALQKAATKFVDSMAKAGGGSVSINGKEIVNIPGENE